MPDKNLTDNEIVKALKTLLELVLVEGCLQRAKTISLALDLINRQKAEIEMLEDVNIRLTKSEARKEFAERVKEIDLYRFIEEYYQNAELRYEVRRDWFDEHIDNLLKEMESADNV